METVTVGNTQNVSISRCLHFSEKNYAHKKRCFYALKVYDLSNALASKL